MVKFKQLNFMIVWLYTCWIMSLKFDLLLVWLLGKGYVKNAVLIFDSNIFNKYASLTVIFHLREHPFISL